MSVENLAGQTLGQYELGDLLGAGAMGAVYIAYQTNLKREVAVKVLPQTFAQDASYTARFKREAEFLASLEHAHIVPIYDFGTQENIRYVVMRLLKGGSLRDQIRAFHIGNRPPFSLAEIATILLQLASALEYAHRHGVVHRDIKPANIVFDDHGDAFLVDFGIAKLIDVTGSPEATGTNTLGTPSYMSPEQVQFESLTPATDQYSLAIVAYEMLTGYLPFEANSPYEVMQKRLREQPTPPEVHRPDTPAAVSMVMEQALSKEPDERFPTVLAFAQAFESAITGVQPHIGNKKGFQIAYGTNNPNTTSIDAPEKQKSLVHFVILTALIVAVVIALTFTVAHFASAEVAFSATAMMPTGGAQLSPSPAPVIVVLTQEKPLPSETTAPISTEVISAFGTADLIVPTQAPASAAPSATPTIAATATLTAMPTDTPATIPATTTTDSPTPTPIPAVPSTASIEQNATVAPGVVFQATLFVTTSPRILSAPSPQIVLVPTRIARASAIPIFTSTPPGTLPPQGQRPAGQETTPILPNVSGDLLRTSLKNILNRGQGRNNRDRIFAVAGDESAVNLLTAFARGSSYQLDERSKELQTIIDWYNQIDLDNATSFNHQSAAASVGWTVSDLLAPNTGACNGGSSRLVCELTLLRPEVLIVSVGNNDLMTDKTVFAQQFQAVVQIALDNGVIPVLMTIQPHPENLGAVKAINMTIIQTAVLNRVPVINLSAQYEMIGNTRQSPNGAGDLTQVAANRYGINARNRAILTVLSAIKTYVFDSE